MLGLSSCGVTLDTTDYNPPYTTTYYVGTSYYTYPPSYWYGGGYRWRPAPPPPPKPHIGPPKPPLNKPGGPSVAPPKPNNRGTVGGRRSQTNPIKSNNNSGGRRK